MSFGEKEITEWFAGQSGAAPEKFPIGIGDDMAQINLGDGKSVLITTDMLLDGVHFDLQKTGIEQVGYKAMAVSLSDCAAMATVPLAAVVSVALPRKFDKDKLKELHKGITQAGNLFGCELIGGDITSWNKPLAINVAMLSSPGQRPPVKRCGAKDGDFLCVTGRLGGALNGKHLTFMPRVEEAFVIAEFGATAMIDISDGISTDLNHICTASEVGAVVEAEKILLSDEAKKTDKPLKAALNDGEDFELLFTISPANFEKLVQQWKMKTPITQIGLVNASKKIYIKNAKGRAEELLPGGYDHL